MCQYPKHQLLAEEEGTDRGRADDIKPQAHRASQDSCLEGPDAVLP